MATYQILLPPICYLRQYLFMSSVLFVFIISQSGIIDAALCPYDIQNILLGQI